MGADLLLCKGRHEVTGQPCGQPLSHAEDISKGFCLHHSYVLVPYFNGPNSGAHERTSPPADEFGALYQAVDAQKLRFSLLKAQLREAIQEELALAGASPENAQSGAQTPKLLKQYGYLDILASDAESRRRARVGSNAAADGDDNSARSSVTSLTAQVDGVQLHQHPSLEAVVGQTPAGPAATTAVISASTTTTTTTGTTTTTRRSGKRTPGITMRVRASTLQLLGAAPALTPATPAHRSRAVHNKGEPVHCTGTTAGGELEVVPTTAAPFSPMLIDRTASFQQLPQAADADDMDAGGANVIPMPPGAREYTTIACRNPRLLALGVHCLLQDYERKPPRALRQPSDDPTTTTTTTESSSTAAGVPEETQQAGGFPQGDSVSDIINAASAVNMSFSALPTPSAASVGSSVSGQVVAASATPAHPLVRRTSGARGSDQSSSNASSSDRSQFPEFRSVYSLAMQPQLLGSSDVTAGLVAGTLTASAMSTESAYCPEDTAGIDPNNTAPAQQQGMAQTATTGQDPWFVVTQGDAYSAALEAAGIIAAELGLQDPADFFTPD